MVDGKLTRLAIVGITKQSRVAGRPSINNRDADASQEMLKFGHSEGGIFETVVIPMNINKDLFAGCQ